MNISFIIGSQLQKRAMMPMYVQNRVRRKYRGIPFDEVDEINEAREADEKKVLMNTLIRSIVTGGIGAGIGALAGKDKDSAIFGGAMGLGTGTIGSPLYDYMTGEWSKGHDDTLKRLNTNVTRKGRIGNREYTYQKNAGILDFLSPNKLTPELKARLEELGADTSGYSYDKGNEWLEGPDSLSANIGEGRYNAENLGDLLGLQKELMAEKMRQQIASSMADRAGGEYGNWIPKELTKERLIRDLAKNMRFHHGGPGNVEAMSWLDDTEENPDWFGGHTLSSELDPKTREPLYGVSMDG